MKKLLFGTIEVARRKCEARIVNAVCRKKFRNILDLN